MRVIAGSAKRLQLATVEGLDTRPTTDRIKETLFNMIQHNLYDSTFLDLFSGSGAIGIEALSRGATSAYFVENKKEAIDCIKKNLKHTHLFEQAVILNTNVLLALRQLEQQDITFDFIFMDPPYGQGYEHDVLLELSQSGHMVNKDTLIIVETDLDADFSFLEDTSLEIIKQKVYKTNMHTFIELGGQ